MANSKEKENPLSLKIHRQNDVASLSNSLNFDAKIPFIILTKCKPKIGMKWKPRTIVSLSTILNIKTVIKVTKSGYQNQSLRWQV